MNWLRSTKNVVTIIGAASERCGRIPGSAIAPSFLQNSKFLNDIPIPIHWERIVEEAKSTKMNQLQGLLHTQTFHFFSIN